MHATVNGNWKYTCVHVCVRFSIEFPAGLVNAGETLLQAAQRELAEETGYSGDIKVLVLTCDQGVHAAPWKRCKNLR